MTASKNALEIIKKFEGFRSRPYADVVGVSTIGYGNTFYLDGRKVKLTDPPISEEEATRLLSLVVNKFAQQVDEVTRPLNQNQFDAVVSLVYNIGIRAYRNSTLLKRIQANPCDPDIAYQFSRWNRAGGQVLNGLTRRRKEEAELYFK